MKCTSAFWSRLRTEESCLYPQITSCLHINTSLGCRAAELFLHCQSQILFFWVEKKGKKKAWEETSERMEAISPEWTDKDGGSDCLDGSWKESESEKREGKRWESSTGWGKEEPTRQSVRWCFSSAVHDAHLRADRSGGKLERLHVGLFGFVWLQPAGVGETTHKQTWENSHGTWLCNGVCVLLHLFIEMH